MISSEVDVIDCITVSESESPSKVKVVIIGAGIAGVTAAAKLYHNGVKDLVVLEAQDYIGGRIKAEVVDGKNIDIGAQFVHGQVGNPLYSIAEALGIVVEEEDGDGDSTEPDAIPTLNSAAHFRLCSNGQQANEKEIIDSCLKFVEEAYNSADPATLDEEVTVGEIYTQAYNDFLMTRGADLSSTTRQLLDASFRCLCAYTNVDNATDDLNELSGWGSLMYEELGGSRYTELHGGMTLILQAILDLLPEGVIHTKSPVIGVKWDRGVSREQNKSNVMVTCENGKRFEADHVIITISSGCLISGLSMFEPPLPSAFTNALRGLQLGVTGKIYLQWESPFWDSDAFMAAMEDSVIDFLWLDSCPVKINSDRSKESTPLGKPWWEGSVGCELVSSHDNMLEFWFTGDQVQVLEQLSDDEVTSVLHELLRVFFDNPNIPKPIGIYRSRWLRNPYVGGTYSYATTSLHRSDVDILSKPIPSMDKPRLLFAGEAFSLKTIGTAHGAYMSGENKAEIILKTLDAGTSNQCTNVLALIQKKHTIN